MLKALGRSGLASPDGNVIAVSHRLFRRRESTKGTARAEGVYVLVEPLSPVSERLGLVKAQITADVVLRLK